MPRTHRSPLSLLVVATLCFWGLIPDRQAAAQTTGSIFGAVVDKDNGTPVGGVTVIAQGPQGEEGTMTGEDGAYEIHALPLGTYIVRFYYGDVTVEQPGVVVSVDKTVRVNARMPAIAVETIQIVEKAPAVDVGSSRVGTTYNQDFTRNTPSATTLGGLLERAPGAFSEPTAFYNPPSAGLSFAGTTGAENSYVLDGVNATSIGFGTLGFDIASPFIEEVEIVTGGYGAEYGHAMGGVVNVATKSGSNEFKGSVVSYLSPGFLSAKPRRVYNWSTSLTGVEEKEFTADLGAEVGGPIIKNKLFFWVGYAPQIGRSHTARYVDRFVDADGNGLPDGTGQPTLDPLSQANFGGKVNMHQYAAKLSYRLGPDHDLSLGFYGINGANEFLRTANADPRTAMNRDEIRRQDLSARWISKFFERRWQVEANLGLHSEGTINGTPYDDLRALNNVTWFNSPSLSALDPALAGMCGADATTMFNSCPAQQYQSGGYGIQFDRQALRLQGQLKSSLLFHAAGLHQLKVGGDYQANQFDNTRSFSGPADGHGLVYVNNGYNIVQSFYRLPPGERVYMFDGDDMTPDANGDGLTKASLLAAPRYQDALRAETKTFNTSVFLQDSYSPLPNLTLNLGVRWEAQQIEDYQGGTPIRIYDSIAPRLGAVYDLTNEGRSKLYGHYGRYYESIPMDLNDRAFGGEGIAAAFYADPGACNTPLDQWGGGNPAMGWKGCATPTPGFMAALAGENLLVQKNIKGSRNDEIVLGAEYEVMSDLRVGAAYIKRWMGAVIEDTAGIVANPGDIPASVVSEYEAKAVAAETASAASPMDAAAAAAAQQARFLADAAKVASTMPKPRRDYDAFQLTASKRISKNWMMHASYTYSQTRGNYPGLYAADKGQLDPNYTSLYDLPDLLMNRDGRLPNDRPHILHVDGYYQYSFGASTVVTGLSAMARSGRPNNALGQHTVYGQSETFILPRGTSGRTPTVTRFDLHLSYKRKLTEGTALDLFVDIFNLFNQRTALTQDQDYTLDAVNPIIGGDARDLPHLKTPDGNPVTKNPNYLAATSYQPPISGRLGLRLTF